MKNEIHIITGPPVKQVLKKLKKWNIHYTHIFSVVDFHKKKKTKMWYTDPENAWMDKETWERTKADYCKRMKIDLHIDDSDKYGKYFTTPYAQFKKGGK